MRWELLLKYGEEESRSSICKHEITTARHLVIIWMHFSVLTSVEWYEVEYDEQYRRGGKMPFWIYGVILNANYHLMGGMFLFPFESVATCATQNSCLDLPYV